MNRLKKMSPVDSRLITRLFAVVLCATMCTTAISMHSIANASTATPSTLSYTFSFASPSLSSQQLLSQSFTHISMPNSLTMGKDAGLPALPVSFIKIALPALTTVDTITVTGASIPVQTPIDLKEEPITPYQHPIPFGDPLPDAIDMDQAIYHSAAPYPASSYDSQYEVGYCRGYAILSIALTPVQYVPAAGTLVYTPQLTVSVNLKPAPMNPLFRNNPDDAAWVQALVCNPDVVPSYHNIGSPLEYPGGLCDPSHHYDYVIITTTQNGLNDWPTSETTPYNWTSLMQHEGAVGLSAVKVTKQDIDACDAYQNTTPIFNDLQAHIREFCKDAYSDWGTEYVLVAGDADTIPARLMSSDAEYNVDADLYWSNLDNSFNANQNGYWGEEGDSGFDLYSELYLGRLTCDTPQDVSNWMTKSFRYAAENDPTILDNAAFYGGDTGWNCQGDDFEDYGGVKGTSNWLGPDPGATGPYPGWMGFEYGFESWNAIYAGVPYSMDNQWTEEPPNPGWHGGYGQGVSGLRNAINNDQVSIISGIAHADEHMSLDVYDTTWETQYHNQHPFFIHDFGCHCGDFDASDDGILDSMLFRSDTYLAFGCVYNTGYGWGAYDDTNSSSAIQQKMFWDYFFDLANNSGSVASWQFGKGHAFSKDEMAPTIDWDSYGSCRETIQCCLLFGDPAQLFKPVRSNTPPSDPSTPQGPASGVVAFEYTFTSTSVDPDNDPILFLFDWGDGTNSGWVGPFPSGGPGSASHIWIKGDTYQVTVTAKDTLGAGTNVSAPASITIGAPVLTCKAVRGGLGAKVVLLNTGEGNASNLVWKIKITGGLLKSIYRETAGMIGDLPVDQAVTLKPFSLSIIGFGGLTVQVTASATYADDLIYNATGFILGPFMVFLP